MALLSLFYCHFVPGNSSSKELFTRCSESTVTPGHHHPVLFLIRMWNKAGRGNGRGKAACVRTPKWDGALISWTPGHRLPLRRRPHEQTQLLELQVPGHGGEGAETKIRSFPRQRGAQAKRCACHAEGEQLFFGFCHVVLLQEWLPPSVPLGSLLCHAPCPLLPALLSSGRRSLDMPRRNQLLCRTACSFWRRKGLWLLLPEEP